MKTDTYLQKSRIIAIVMVVLAICFGNACKKDNTDPVDTVKTYAQITFADIKAKVASFSEASLVISNSTEVLFKSGDIIIYRTSLGNYGKMEIISIDQADNYKMTINASTYSSSGSVIKNVSSVTIRGTWIFDLDEMVEIGDVSDKEDFQNERINDTDTHFTPKNGAAFIRYSL